MPAPTDGESTNLILKWGGFVVSGLLAVAGAFGGRIVKKHDEEIASIKGSLADLKSGQHRLEVSMPNDYVKQETWDQNRQETREAVIGLHRKIEEGQRDAAQRHDQLVRLLLERRETRRASD